MAHMIRLMDGCTLIFFISLNFSCHSEFKICKPLWQKYKRPLCTGRNVLDNWCVLCIYQALQFPILSLLPIISSCPTIISILSLTSKLFFFLFKSQFWPSQVFSVILHLRPLPLQVLYLHPHPFFLLSQILKQLNYLFQPEPTLNFVLQPSVL